MEQLNELKTKLAKILLEKSYFEGKFKLSSGKISNYYFDCRQTALHPEGLFLLGKIFLKLLNPEVKAVGGVTLGADPLVSAVSVLSYLEKRPIPAFIIRKTPKNHGTKNYIEGSLNLEKGQKVAILDDVVTTGASLLRACKIAESADLKVIQVLCVLDREEGGRENLEKEGYKLEPIFTKKELLAYKR